MAAIGASQWLRLTKEATWGTFDGSAITANILWIRLTEGNSWVAEPNPMTWDVRGADGFNLRQQRGAPVTMFPFALKTVLYPAQAVKLVPWAFVPTANVLDSYTADWWDGIEIRRLLGCRPTDGKVSTDDSSFVAQLEISGYGKNYGTPPSLPQPASSVFVAERPYVHQDSAALCTYGAASPPTLATYSSLEVSVKNVLDARAFESSTIQICDYNGRDVDFTLARLYLSNAERVAYQAQNIRSSSIEWQVLLANGYSADHAITFNMENTVYIGSRSIQRSFDKDVMESLSLMAYKDPTAGVDCAIVAT